jgi:pSer/pThr/pTyr-binding forkhead associated (FHA) protein
MQIQLSWEDPVTGEMRQPVFTVPVALGREIGQMPTNLDGQQVSRAVFRSEEISRFHALIASTNGKITIADRSANATFVNGEKVHNSSKPLNSGDTLQIGPYSLTIGLLVTPESDPTKILNQESTIIFNPNTNVLSSKIAEAQKQPVSSPPISFNPDTDNLQTQLPQIPPVPNTLTPFPPPGLFAADRVSVEALHATGKQVEETTYAAVGGGMGTFVWVDTVRICGVKREQIAVISLESKPYGRYQRLCRNSQIPGHERIRSGSDSCPDNVWGWPGYAWREAAREITSGQFVAGFKHFWQVFAEPVFADTYTPRAQNVFASMDREAKRIGWDEMLRYGRVRGIRKTDDGRYAIAYSVPQPNSSSEHRFLLSKYIHLATGYPAIRFLPDLQDYRAKTGDFKSVVNAYEEHEHVYEQLSRQGGTVIVRGRGIVASRILQRLYETRQPSNQISVIHLMQSPKTQGNKFGLSQRYVENQWEFQPYNWPKGTWGGDMRAMLEAANPLKRYELLTAWGGTTTASREDWRHIVKAGMQAGWYTIKFGQVERVEKQNGKLVTYIKSGNYEGIEKIKADFIIDSTGLEAKPKDNPLLDDLISHYNLLLNPFGRLHVANDFEIVEMRNDRAKIYAAGIMTLGGPYAPVDTFLGLQYAAHRAAEGLARAKAPGIRHLEGIGSLWQWLKWATNHSPS